MTPVEFRRHLHRHPELSFRETESARFIAEALREAGIPCRPIAGTGVLAKIEGRGDLRRAVVLRADIDALPVTERMTVLEVKYDAFLPELARLAVQLPNRRMSAFSKYAACRRYD